MCVREIKTKIENVSARLKMNGVGWEGTACLVADDMALFAEEEFEKVVDEFYSVCTRRK